MAVVSLPWRFACAIASPAAFCSRFSSSTSLIARRRRPSRVAISSRALSTSRPRLRRPARTLSICLRPNSGSSIDRSLYIPPQLDLCYDLSVGSAVRKAVFPAAGLGTRFLPATKAQPKEMLPLVDKPIIQYGVEEAVSSGVDNIILVTGRGKNAIEDHFDVSVELDTFLQPPG